MIHSPKQTPASDETEEIVQRFKDFAIRHIAAYPGLHQQTRFPENLWHEMQEYGLFGIGIDPAYRGKADGEKKPRVSPYRLLSIAGNTMAAHGGNLGVCLSWLIHEMTALWLIQSTGTGEQKKIYLPDLASGKFTACLAISEPGIGAHPKHLATTAEAVSDGFMLNGEKTYLTNAPLADLFIVIAVTGNADGKKQFTAFLVPKSTPGLTLSAQIAFPFLHPSPHGGIVLKNCTVASGQILGKLGCAYEDLVLPFRTVEDTLMMGPIAGGLASLLGHLIAQLNQDRIIPDEPIITTSAQLHCATEALAAISITAAGELYTDSRNEKLTAFGLFFRDQAGECLNRIQMVIEKTGITQDAKLSCMMGDLSAAIRIAENVSRIKLQKLGKRLFGQPF